MERSHWAIHGWNWPQRSTVKRCWEGKLDNSHSERAASGGRVTCVRDDGKVLLRLDKGAG